MSAMPIFCPSVTRPPPLGCGQRSKFRG
jgi:hypothetical protein